MRWMNRGARLALGAVVLAMSVGSGWRVALAHPRGAAREQALEEARRLNQEVLRLLGAGQYREAATLAERALRIREAALGANHPDVATSLNNLAEVFRAMGQYDRAVPLLERALRIRESALGANHSDVAQSLNNLALVLRAMGQYDRAVLLHERALRIYEVALGANHSDVALSLNNLAEVFVSLGQYDRAVPLLERALRIQEAALGANHPYVALSLNNLAEVFVSLGQYDRAVPLHERTLRIQEAALGANHPYVAVSLNNLAAAFYAMGRYDHVVPLLERALRILEAALGVNHPDVARSLNNLAAVFRAMGQYGRAVPLLKRALSINESALGANHPDVANSLNNLAVVFVSLGQYGRAVPLLERAQRIRAERFATLLPVQHESGADALLSTASGDHDVLHTFATEHPSDPRTRSLGLNAALLFKARALDESASSLVALRSSADPADRAAVTRVDQLRAQLTRLRAARSPDIAATAAQLSTAAEQLSRRSAALRERRHFPALAELIPSIARRLHPEAALLEIVTYSPYNPRTPRTPWGAPRYVAYVLHPDGTHAVVPLGETSALDPLASELPFWISANPPEARSRCASRPFEACRTEQLTRATRALWAALIAPLLPHLRPTTRRLIFSPDGALSLAPLHLAHDGTSYLFDRYTVSYTTTGRDLLRERSTESTSPPTALVATTYPTPSWNREGLRIQAELLPSLIPGVRLLRDDDATESSLRALRSPRVLHLGAHGEFTAPPANDDTLQASMRAARLLLGDARSLTASPDGSPDGIVTAEDISQLPLFGTQLVVLSACQTATGTTTTGRGVFGLRRAFTLAGAEAIVTTQWNVDDAAALLFTRTLYTRLRAGDTSADAVTTAMRAVRDTDADPFAWAPFVLVGRDAPVDVAPAPAAPAPARAN